MSENSSLSIAERTLNLGDEHAFVVLQAVAKLQGAGRDIVSFAIGQPDFATPANVCAAATRALEQGHTGYTPSLGIAPLREAVAAYLARTRKITVAPDEVVVACGAKPFIMYTILSVTEAGAGHEVIYPQPGFPIYESQARACGAIPVPLPFEDGVPGGFSLAALERSLSSRTRLLILNSPHNPSGFMLSEEQLRAIADRLAEFPKVWVLADEVYSQMTHGVPFASLASMPGMQERTVILDGVSKSYAMTGWRLGFAANAVLAEHLGRWITNTESCAPSVAQWAALEALTGPQEAHHAMMQTFTRRGRFLAEGLNDLRGVTVAAPQGAFYLWPDVGALCRMSGCPDAETLRQRWLHEAEVAVLADQQFGVKATLQTTPRLRFSFAASESDLERGLARLRTWIANNA